LKARPHGLSQRASGYHFCMPAKGARERPKSTGGAEQGAQSATAPLHFGVRAHPRA